jgi:hypothetical protein
MCSGWAAYVSLPETDGHVVQVISVGTERRNKISQPGSETRSLWSKRSLLAVLGDHRYQRIVVEYDAARQAMLKILLARIKLTKCSRVMIAETGPMTLSPRNRGPAQMKVWYPSSMRCIHTCH